MRVIVYKKEIVEAVTEWLAKRNLKITKFGFEALHNTWIDVEDVIVKFDVTPIEVKDHPYR